MIELRVTKVGAHDDTYCIGCGFKRSGQRSKSYGL